MALTTLLKHHYPKQSPMRVSIALQNWTCPRMRILLADTTRSVGRTAPVVNWLTECPHAPPPAARSASGPPRSWGGGGGGSRCPECWGMPGEGTREPPEMPVWRYPLIPRNQKEPSTPYLTQERRQLRFTAITATAAKGAVKCRAAVVLVAVGDDHV